MKFVVLAFTALASSFANAATTPLPEPEMWALLGIAGVAAVAVKHFKK